MDLGHLRGWIGREETAFERLAPGLVARFAATFDRDWPVEEGAEAPLLIHFCLAPGLARTADLGPDGHAERGGFLPPVPLPRRMWAGGAFEFHGAIRVGETVERRSRVEAVELKEGRSGQLVFVTVRHDIRSDGRPALTERQDIVYRGAARSGEPPAPEAAAPPGHERRTVAPSAALLFRYSALTFNGHRIHYDRDWASGEGYPGLVVHGPLQATWLVQMAADLGGAPPRRFAFRSRSALYDDAGVGLHAGERGPEGLRLWTARPGGPVAMEGLTEW